MTVFLEMHQRGGFGGWRDYHELKRMLGETIKRSYVIEVPVSSDQPHSVGERWFLEKETGIVFRLLQPNPPDGGDWSEVEFPEPKSV